MPDPDARSRRSERTVVLGLGNPLLADDGIGIEVLDRLRRHWELPPEVELVDGGVWGLSLLPEIEDAGRLLLVDAIDLKLEPGSLVVLEREDLPAFLDGKLSTHQVGLRDLLALAVLRGTLPERTVAMGLQPESMELEPGLTDRVEAGMARLMERVLDRLRTWGTALRPLRPEDAPASSPAPAARA